MSWVDPATAGIIPSHVLVQWWGKLGQCLWQWSSVGLHSQRMFLSNRNLQINTRSWNNIERAYHPYNAKIYLYKPWRPKGFFSIWNVLVNYFGFIWIPMLRVYGNYKFVNSFSDERRQNLTSDVCRRQIVTSKSRFPSWKSKIFTMTVDP